MDPTKPSLSSKALHVNNGGGSESSVEEGSALQRDSVDGERTRDMESREADVVDGITAAAEINHHHRGSADKNKFNTMGYQRQTRQKVVTDFATVNKGASAGSKPRAALKQSLFSQGVSDKNRSEERGQLDVLKQVLQAYAVPINLQWSWNKENQGTTLEKKWMDLVQSHSTMAKIQRHQQDALWEFVHTELTYINKLLIIKDLVIAALVNVRQHGFLLEVTPEQLFSNIPSILSAHQLFWKEVIYPMLHEVRRTGKPFDPMRLEAGCLQFQERFSCYNDYCWEEENNLEFTRREVENNPQFQTYVQWVESHPQCDRMRLGDMQAKPHQRITKYPLLLKAVLRYTQDPHAQHTLRGMLSNVNVFLESINDYLRLKDEALALSISAQRVEGYEVEGINEEIDKHVKEICQFDLTCPIRGVGSNIIRKLLLEENLKLRGRKDSKLEVVALLFSDVLLMTKVQKKGERLKVVRPPLVLDRSHCIALKDGFSFVLVEVGELRSAMSVYIFAASTSESCSKWISTIHEAKETLSSLRETEANRQQQNWKIQQVEAKLEAEADDLETEQQPVTQSEEETFVDELNDETNSINNMLQTTEAEEECLPDDVGTDTSESSVLYLPPMNKIQISIADAKKGNQMEEEKKIVESQMTIEQRVSTNHKASNLDDFTVGNSADSLRYNTTRPHALLVGGLPDVDYPTNEDSTLQPSHQQTISGKEPVARQLPEEKLITTGRYSASRSVNQDTRRNSSYGEADEIEAVTESSYRVVSKKSSLIRRKRPVNTIQGSLVRMSNQESRKTLATSNNNSSSNTDSDYKLNTKINSVPSGQTSDSHRVLKLGALRPNQGMFWSMHDDVQSPDSLTVSESKLPGLNKGPQVKSPENGSVLTEGGRGPDLPSHSMSTSPQVHNTQNTHFASSGNVLNRKPSLLEGVLERAKVKTKEMEQDVLKRERNLKMTSLSYRTPSPSFFTIPSPSPDEGDREENEWGEKEVVLTRQRASTVSEGWKEQLVDEDDVGNRSGLNFTDGVNVDWSGWCVDDEEVMNHLHPEGDGLLKDISRSFPFWDLQGYSEQSVDGECSQV